MRRILLCAVLGAGCQQTTTAERCEPPTWLVFPEPEAAQRHCVDVVEAACWRATTDCSAELAGLFHEQYVDYATCRSDGVSECSSSAWDSTELDAANGARCLDALDNQPCADFVGTSHPIVLPTACSLTFFSAPPAPDACVMITPVSARDPPMSNGYAGSYQPDDLQWNGRPAHVYCACFNEGDVVQALVYRGTGATERLTEANLIVDPERRWLDPWQLREPYVMPKDGTYMFVIGPISTDWGVYDDSDYRFVLTIE